MAAQLDGDSVLQRLLAGNRRWVQGVPALALVADAGAAPQAALVCCSELGPTPELLFSRLPGSLFVLQGAGVRSSDSVVAGLTYAVEAFELRLVMIMAHTGCALAEFVGDGPMRLESGCGCRGSTAPAWCASRTAQQLGRTPALVDVIAEHEVEVAALVFDRDSGHVRLVG